MVDNDIPANTSQQYLVVSAEQTYTTQESTRRSMPLAPTGLKLVTCQEWATVIILCYVNLINYMDRYTVAGKNLKLNNYSKFFQIINMYRILRRITGIVSFRFINRYSK